MPAEATIVELIGGPLDGELAEVPARCSCCGELTEDVGSVLELCGGLVRLRGRAARLRSLRERREG